MCINVRGSILFCFTREGFMPEIFSDVRYLNEEEELSYGMRNGPRIIIVILII